MGGWNVEIFDCVKNPTMFMWACLVPCGICCMQMLDAQLAEPEKKNAMLYAGLLVCFCGTIGGIINRYRLRMSLEISDSILFDILFWCCVPCCAVTQEYMQTMERKKKNRNMPIWEAYKS
jgi:Cys-rich protein (TIGR01571 family)